MTFPVKISVITPVLNGARYLRKTIESVLSQSGDFELEYIVKDGGSTDGTMELLKEYADDSSVTVISKKDQSLYDAINQGFAHATGDIGCWINADDYYDPHALQKAVLAFAKHPEKQWLYGRCNIVDAGGVERRRCITQYKNMIGWVYSYNVLLCENYINQPATFWKMTLWKKVGGLDRRYQIAADYHLWLKFAQYSAAIALHEKLANFRRCGESISDKQFEQQFREELSVARPFCNPIIYAIHFFNCWKIIKAYHIMRKFNS
jgi:glycosyltransferase involved in cell wall biosynthesis